MQIDIEYYMINNRQRTGFNMYIVTIMMNIKYNILNILLDKTKKKALCSMLSILIITYQRQ